MVRRALEQRGGEMKYTVHSRKHGYVTFSRPGRGYVFVDLNGQPGTLGKQICDGGNLMGNTISYSGESYEAFEKICNRWWRDYLKNHRGMDFE